MGRVLVPAAVGVALAWSCGRSAGEMETRAKVTESPAPIHSHSRQPDGSGPGNEEPRLGKVSAIVADKWWLRPSPCPANTSMLGTIGRAVECVGPGSTRHGFRATWNRFGHLSSLEAWNKGKRVALRELRPWRLVVLSDIHIYPNGRIPRHAKKVVAYVAAMKPRLVVITGDSTNGNKGDRFSTRRVALWWARLHELLTPLYRAKIPVLPVAGNHDAYRQVHRDGYADAWKDLATKVAPLAINPGGNPPWYYSVDVDGTRLSLLHLVTQHMNNRQRAWLEKDLGSAKSSLKLAFGHVPLSSAIAPPQRIYVNKMMGLLGPLGLDAYVCGHEHFLWDEVLVRGEHRIRQVMAGPASGTYHYGMRPALARKWCKGRLCRFPADNGYRFRIKRDREQVLLASFVAMDVYADNTAFEVHPYRLRRGGAIETFERSEPGHAGTQ